MGEGFERLEAASVKTEKGESHARSSRRLESTRYRHADGKEGTTARITAYDAGMGDGAHELGDGAAED